MPKKSQSNKIERRNSTSISLDTCILSSEFLINQMKNIVFDLLKTFSKSECDAADEINNAIIENFHFQNVSKLLHDFHQFTSC